MCIEDKTSGTPNLLDFRECPADSRPVDAEPCKLPDCIGKYPMPLVQKISMDPWGYHIDISASPKLILKKIMLTDENVLMLW